MCLLGGDILVHDNESRTVRIPVRIVNGMVKYYYGGDLPDIKDHIIGDLILPDYSIKDDKFLSISQQKEDVEILPEGSIIMVSVSTTSIPKEKRQHLKKIKSNIVIDKQVIDIQLLEPLYMHIRGSKKPNLSAVKCKIPSLEKDASSINNAYTLISQVYESHRKSYGGSVFNQCYYKEKDNIWYPLDNLRQKKESEFEEKLFLDYKIFVLNENFDENIKLTNSEQLLVNYLKEFIRITGVKIKDIYNKDKSKYISVINTLTDKNIIKEVKDMESK